MKHKLVPTHQTSPPVPSPSTAVASVAPRRPPVVLRRRRRRHRSVKVLLGNTVTEAEKQKPRGEKRRALVGELFAYIFIQVIAVIGILFALYQWFLVSGIRLSLDRQPSEGGIAEALLDEEEEGVDANVVVTKCCEIQNAISIGCIALCTLLAGAVCEPHSCAALRRTWSKPCLLRLARGSRTSQIWNRELGSRASPLRWLAGFYFQRGSVERVLLPKCSGTPSFRPLMASPEWIRTVSWGCTTRLATPSFPTWAMLVMYKT
ncbi:Pyrophosphate-energized vacuolar membrane proton pump [Nymphaea thermarum]|nr:Pyrophosphate-energized vacuolar membrane proton pump [Nymphaea thermarum]